MNAHSRNLRLELARKLRELADNSTEADLRSALSRSYYSVYHVARAVLGKVGHQDIAEEVGKVDVGLAESVKRFQRLRSQADYDPNFVEREFNGDLELFRLEVRKQVEDGLFVYRRLLVEAGREQETEDSEEL